MGKVRFYLEIHGNLYYHDVLTVLDDPTKSTMSLNIPLWAQNHASRIYSIDGNKRLFYKNKGTVVMSEPIDEKEHTMIALKATVL